MDKLNTGIFTNATKSKGYPLSVDDLKFILDGETSDGFGNGQGIYQGIDSLSSIFGGNVVISGCEITTGTNIGPGWVCINGELLYFPSGTISPGQVSNYLIKDDTDVTSNDTKRYKDGDLVGSVTGEFVYVTKKAKILSISSTPTVPYIYFHSGGSTFNNKQYPQIKLNNNNSNSIDITSYDINIDANRDINIDANRDINIGSTDTYNLTLKTKGDIQLGDSSYNTNTIQMWSNNNAIIYAKNVISIGDSDYNTNTLNLRAVDLNMDANGTISVGNTDTSKINLKSIGGIDISSDSNNHSGGNLNLDAGVSGRMSFENGTKYARTYITNVYDRSIGVDEGFTLTDILPNKLLCAHVNGYLYYSSEHFKIVNFWSDNGTSNGKLNSTTGVVHGDFKFEYYVYTSGANNGNGFMKLTNKSSGIRENVRFSGTIHIIYSTTTY